MKQVAVFVLLVGLVIAEQVRSPADRKTRRRGRQYEQFNQGYNGGDGFYQGQELDYEKVYHHHNGSPKEVQYDNVNTQVKSYKSEELQLPDYGYENGHHHEVPVGHFQHAVPYDFQYENQLALQFGKKEPATFNVEYVPVSPSPLPVVYPSVEAVHSPLPEVKKPLHVVPLKHAFAPEPNPFPIPERFQFHKNLVVSHAKAALPPPPPPPPSHPPTHVTPVKNVGFKLNLLKPLLHGSLPPPAAPLPTHEAYDHLPPAEDYFVPLPVVTKVPPPPPPPPKVPAPHPVAPLKKFFTFFQKFKLS